MSAIAPLFHWAWHVKKKKKKDDLPPPLPVLAFRPATEIAEIYRHVSERVFDWPRRLGFDQPPVGSQNDFCCRILVRDKSRGTRNRWLWCVHTSEFMLPPKNTPNVSHFRKPRVSSCYLAHTECNCLYSVIADLHFKKADVKSTLDFLEFFDLNHVCTHKGRDTFFNHGSPPPPPPTVPLWLSYTRVELMLEAIGVLALYSPTGWDVSIYVSIRARFFVNKEFLFEVGSLRHWNALDSYPPCFVPPFLTLPL